jgi:hypothetical protein
MTISRYRLDRLTFIGALVLGLLWATDEMWEQAFLCASAVTILGIRVWREREN